MKKLLLGTLGVAVVVAFALNASATEMTEKSSVKQQGDRTVEKTEVKGGGMEAKSTVTTTPEGVETKEEVKTKGVKVEKERVDTAEGSAGKTKVDVKKGALKDFNIEWVYYRKGTEYIIEYDIKDKSDKELLTELNLTPTQAELIKPGVHRIVSTSPYTAGDVKANFQAVIIKDLASTIKK